MNPRPINQLPASLVNRIAAGEVIERPASVVKELVENAIDAGATQIRVEIEDGGTTLIRVTDNGHGIPPGDLGLAFAPHATSKLQTDEDLFNILTMGFRGEALASIGSVSHSRILSRVSSDDAAYEIFNRGGAISDPQAAPGNIGTTIEVRNLFFNVPARRKFLKGQATEYGHIAEMLQRLALPHPEVGFTLMHNNRSTMNLPVVADPVERLLSAWPDEFHEQRLPLEARDAEIWVRGVIGLPELARPVAKYQYLYLNGRPIRDKYIQHAIREAYRGLTEPGRHPAAILLLTVPPTDVDVNVHPTKFEVRFKDSGRIHGLVLSSIRERLLGSDLTPNATLRADAPAAERMDMQEKLAAFFKQMPPVMSTGNLQDSGFGIQGSGIQSETSTRFDSAPPILSPQSSALSPNPTPEPRALTAISAIQLHNSYLVAESDDGLVIIDQHALHERIMFEELLARLTRGPLESQRLLIPHVIEASARQIEMAGQIQALLMKLGIEVTEFGPTSLAVQAFPSFLERLEPGEFIRELLEKGEQELLDLHEEELLHEVLDMMACKAAIKAGDPLTPQEIEALLARRDLVERSSNCPHGRPTTLRLSLRDLEKQFKRTGF